MEEPELCYSLNNCALTALHGNVEKPLASTIMEGSVSEEVAVAGLLARLLKRDRKFWHVCYQCLQNSGNDPVKAIFYHEGPPVVILGRPWAKCPRCGNTNTISFRQLKDEGSEAQLWGLERIIKKYPRSQFEVKSSVATTCRNTVETRSRD